MPYIPTNSDMTDEDIINNMRYAQVTEFKNCLYCGEVFAVSRGHPVCPDRDNWLRYQTKLYNEELKKIRERKNMQPEIRDNGHFRTMSEFGGAAVDVNMVRKMKMDEDRENSERATKEAMSKGSNKDIEDQIGRIIEEGDSTT